MKVSYHDTEDVLYVQLSEAPVVKDESYGEKVTVGYDADGQLVEITILDLSSVLAKAPEEDESTLVLTERESRRLLELMESPPPRSERFLAGRTRYRQHLEAENRAIEDDGDSLDPVRSETISDETTGITHITPVGGNIFLDLGFPPEEAEQLKEESDRLNSSKHAEIPLDESDRPEPPEGYATWLDYAVDTMDTRSQETAQLFLDKPPSGQAMRDAVRAELAALRRRAANR